MGQTTKTVACAWSRVFRGITTQCKSDLDIKRVIGDGLRIWDGSPLDKTPFVPTDTNTIQVRLTPMPKNVDWYSPDTQMGVLVVKTEITVQSLDITDYLDVWDLFVNALRPSSLTFCQSLVALGAETGQIVFADPALSPNPDTVELGYFVAVANFHLNILRTIYCTSPS